MLAFDNMIFFMTIYKSVEQSRGRNRTLTYIFLRDGGSHRGHGSFLALTHYLRRHLLWVRLT